MRIFVCFSGNASAFRDIRHNYPGWRYDYEVVGAATDNGDAPGRLFFEEHTIPCEYIDRSTPRQFDHCLAETIMRYNPDYIVFSGFMRIVTNDFIDRFEGKIVNIHPADLSIIDSETGKRAFTGKGIDAIRKTIESGRKTICATTHMVEKGAVDGGRILAQSLPCVIAPNETPQMVQNRLKIIADGQALHYTIRMLISQGYEE